MIRLAESAGDPGKMLTMANRWEYTTLKIEPTGLFGGKVDTDELVSRLTELGSRGWELVTSIESSHVDGGSSEAVLVLKRPLAG